MISRRAKIVLGLSAGVGIAVGAAVHSRDVPSRLGFRSVNESRVDQLRALVAPEREGPRDPERLYRFPLTEEEVTVLMPLEGKKRVWDPLCYFRPESNLVVRARWEEYPGGRFVRKTNSLGMNQDFEPSPIRPDLRVLVAGDSHMAGVCSNADGMPGQLSSMLATSDPTRTVEVCNASEGAYSFYHYIGALERMLHLDLAPDVLVVVVFGGNDFTAVWMRHFFENTKRVAATPDAIMRKMEFAQEDPSVVGQCLNAAEYFRRGGPREVENALITARQATYELSLLCDENDIDLLVVYLPAPSEIPTTAEQTRIQAGLERLQLVQADLDLLGTMGDRYLAEAAELGVATLDLRPTFADAGRELYRRRDLHLAIAGHALAAETIAPWIEERWSERR